MTSSSCSGNGTKGHHNFTLNVWETYVSDGTNNYSDIYWTLVLSPIVKGYDWNFSSTVPVTWSVSINGQTASGNIMQYDGSSTITVSGGPLRIYHDENGSKQIGFNFSVNSIERSYLPGSASGANVMWLTDIPRKAIITSAPDFNDEDNPTITYNNPLGNNVTGLYACISFDGIQDNIPYREIPITGTSYTFNFTDEERKILREATTESNSMSVGFYVRTIYAGNTYHSYVYKTMTIINGNPIFNDFVYQDINENVTNITGDNQVLIKGLSNLQVTISENNKMEAIKEASPKNYLGIIDTKNVSAEYVETGDVNLNIGTVENSGDKVLTIRAYDSRNNSTPVVKNVSVLDYSVPIINVSAERLNNFEERTTLTVNGEYSKILINEVEKNAIKSVQYKYRENGGTWSDWLELEVISNNGSFSCSDGVMALDSSKTFEIEVQAIDNFNTIITTNVNVDSGKSIFWISDENETAYIGDDEIATYETLKPKILWTNPSPSDDFFYEQEITLNTDDYDELEIRFHNFKGKRTMGVSGRVPKNNNFEISNQFAYINGLYWGMREIVFNSETTLTIGNCVGMSNNNLSSFNVVNDWLLPIEIIGYKYSKEE